MLQHCKCNINVTLCCSTVNVILMLLILILLLILVFNAVCLFVSLFFFQEKDLKQYMDDCGGIMSMNNVRVSANKIYVCYFFLYM